MRSPSEKALDARLAEGRTNAVADGADTAGSAAQIHLNDARREVREREERERSRGSRLPSAPLHPVGVSPASQAPPLRSNSILGSLGPRIQEEPDIPPRNPARVSTAPVSGPLAESVDEVTRANDAARSLSTSDASAMNPGHNALNVVNHFTPPRRSRGREDSCLTGLTVTGPSKPGDETVNGADGQVSPKTVS